MPSSTREWKKWIADQVAALGLAMGEEPSAHRLAVYAEDLCDIPREQLAPAFQKARHTYEYPKLPPVAFIRRMAGFGSEADGRPGPEEAWAKMPKGERMEEDTVVWCEEEREAYGACRGLLLDGDLIGARMAFKERYEKELANARSQRRPVKWIICSGQDKESRLAVLATAVQQRRISVESALKHVPLERQEEFASMLPPEKAKGLLTGQIEKTVDLPGLPGLLAKMQMDGLLPESVKAPLKPLRRSPADRSDDEVRRLREKANAQREMLKQNYGFGENGNH